jgi:hypothetical protein
MIPGKTLCPTCGRRFPLPERVCAFCRDAPATDALMLQIPGMGAVPARPAEPSGSLFRNSWGPSLLWVLVVTLLLAVSTFVAAVALD